jgi:ribosome-associated protein
VARPSPRETTGSHSLANAQCAARAALDKQAEDVVILDLRTLSSVTDFFVIGTAGSSRQLEALAEHVEAMLERREAPVRHSEGRSSARPGGPDDLQWVLLDCGDVVVHLLDQRARSFYRLEDLWADAPRIPLPPQ